MQGLIQWFRNSPPRWLWVLFGLAGIAVTAKNILIVSDGAYTHYNNYIIFKNSFTHWLNGLNLYIQYPAEQYDLFKYSPFFAMVFGVFSIFPDWLGLGIWNLLNLYILVYAVSQLPLQKSGRNLAFGLLILQEAITATMNSQSNALLAGLLILGWLALEKGNWWKAAVFISFTVFIKLFGVLFFVLFLLYPKWWKGIIPAVSVCLAMLILPAVSGGTDTLLMQYKGYLQLLANDHGEFVKYSVMGWLQSWFGLVPAKNMVVLLGFVIQLGNTAFLLFRVKSEKARALCAASWLVWMVIFNHMAESATFIIAVSGVMLWFFYTSAPNWFRFGLLMPVLAFTCFGPSDVYPPEWRQKIVIDWQLKVFPCILVWAAMVVELFRYSISSSARLQPEPL